jgi:3-oxoacyl-[acyl-carrier protein] reductase
MNLNLSDKSALVCGSSQGIGLAAAQEIALLGANVTLLARNEQSLNQALETLDTSQDQQHNVLVADFTDNQAVRELVAEHNQYHILVNNTGGPPGGQAIDANEDEFLQAFNNHLINNQILAKDIVPFMKAEGYGRIINIISTSVKAPIPGLGVSNTIRGAVNSWSKTLANELGQFGITVNNVLPGATSTMRLSSIIENKANKLGRSISEVENAMLAEIPAKRFADATEVASAVAFLAAPAAGYINGISIAVDGGRTGCL